jgi:hypothetical protein
MAPERHLHYPSPPSTLPASTTASTPGSETVLSKDSRRRAQRSQVETGFFDAITQRMRRGRSSSRNRVEKSRSRSRSPLVLPPEQIPTQRAAAPMSPSQAAPQRPPQPRHASTTSQSSIQTPQSPLSPTRPGIGQQRRSSDLWHGRQTNSWLFNDVSLTETAKDLFRGGRKSP